MSNVAATTRSATMLSSLSAFGTSAAWRGVRLMSSMRSTPRGAARLGRAVAELFLDLAERGVLTGELRLELAAQLLDHRADALRVIAHGVRRAVVRLGGLDHRLARRVDEHGAHGRERLVER